jgi:nitrite reductase/ring-hydroxylating ferredoxin subunit
MDRITEGIGTAKVLDKPSKMLRNAAEPLLPQGMVTDVLSGKQLGHPFHPAMMAVPLGAFLSTSVVDTMRNDGAEKAAERLITAGLLGSIPTVLAGLSDWRYTSGTEKRVGFVHAAVNTAALATYAASLVARRRGHVARGKLLALAGSGLLGFGGSLGGHLSYALGVGVDTNVINNLPTQWKPVIQESKVAEASMLPVDVDGIRALVTRVDGEIKAISNRCSHRGAPLNEGTREGDCVRCPWHASVFDIKTGAVISGPAVRPLPKFDVRVHEGMVEIRLTEVHSTLTTNSDAPRSRV